MWSSRVAALEGKIKRAPTTASSQLLPAPSSHPGTTQCLPGMVLPFLSDVKQDEELREFSGAKTWNDAPLLPQSEGIYRGPPTAPPLFSTSPGHLTFPVQKSQKYRGHCPTPKRAPKVEEAGALRRTRNGPAWAKRGVLRGHLSSAHPNPFSSSTWRKSPIPYLGPRLSGSDAGPVESRSAASTC